MNDEENAKLEANICPICITTFNGSLELLKHVFQKHVSCLKCKENCQNVENTSSENKVVKTEIVDVVHNEAGSISDIKQEYEEKDPLCMLDDLKEESQTNETPYCNSFLIYQAAKYKCDICKIPFSTLKHLKTHHLLHDNVRYNCVKCEKNFYDKSTLNKHIQSVHGKIRYNCDKCGKSFSSKQYLNTHIQSVHQNIRYNCYKCGKSFSQKEYFNTHIKSVHPLDPLI